jgi:hypothetical protein
LSRAGEPETFLGQISIEWKWLTENYNSDNPMQGQHPEKFMNLNCPSAPP